MEGASRKPIHLLNGKYSFVVDSCDFDLSFSKVFVWRLQNVEGFEAGRFLFEDRVRRFTASRRMENKISSSHELATFCFTSSAMPLRIIVFTPDSWIILKVIHALSLMRTNILLKWLSPRRPSAYSNKVPLRVPAWRRVSTGTWYAGHKSQTETSSSSFGSARTLFQRCLLPSRLGEDQTSPCTPQQIPPNTSSKPIRLVIFQFRNPTQVHTNAYSEGV